MNIPQFVLSIVLFLLSLFLIAVVLLQEGKTAGLNGAISGGADTFLSKNKARTLDAKLARWTKWVAILFMLICVALALV